MVASLHDGHGNVYRGQQVTGVLPVLLRWVEGHVFIASVKDTAATNARRGDIVLAIDGTPVNQLLIEIQSPHLKIRRLAGSGVRHKRLGESISKSVIRRRIRTDATRS